MSNAGYIQTAPDGSGKRVANVPVELPTGTQVVDGSGVVTSLTAPVTVFVQKVLLADAAGVGVDVGGFGETLDDLQRSLKNIYRCLRVLTDVTLAANNVKSQDVDQLMAEVSEADDMRNL